LSLRRQSRAGALQILPERQCCRFEIVQMTLNSVLAAAPVASRPGRRRFRGFVLSADRLTHDGRTVAVPPKPLAVLNVLAAREGDIVSKSDLIASVWHGAPIADESIARSIFMLRRAIGDIDATAADAVETAYGRGYRFALESCVEPDAALEDGPARALRDARRALFTAATLDPADHRVRTCLTLVDALLADGHSAGAAEFERALSRVESERRRRNSALAETLPDGVHIFVDPLRGP
jgi:DNA-binding winged helix-turn-helix (wHTH) protein